MNRTLILAFGLVLASCTEKAPPMAFVPPPVPVQTADVEVSDVPLFFEAMGVIKPARTAEVKPQVNGIIKEVHFTEGSWVNEGDLLFTIEEAPYRVRVQEMQAQLAQDMAHWNNAKKKWERYKSLNNQDLIAKVEWDEMETKIKLHEAMVMADKARLTAAKLDLEHCRIVAPISGKTGKIALQAGNMAGGSILVTLTETNPLYVDFSITEKELLEITSSHPQVKVFVAGNEECLADGKVTFMDHGIDPKSGMLSAKALLESVHHPLWPGQSVRVQLIFGKKEQAKLIPMRAIKTNQDGPYIFTVKEDNTVEIRSVKLGPEQKGKIVIEEGVAKEEKIVIEGHSRLIAGSKVEDIK